MNHKTSRILMWVLFLLGLIILGLSAFIRNSNVPYLFVYIGGAVMASGILVAILFLRCPHCGGRLYTHGFSPDHCPHCGEKLD